MSYPELAYDILNEYVNECCDVVFFNANSLDTDTYLPTGRIRHLNAMHEQYKKSPQKAILLFKYLYGEPSSRLIKREFVKINNIKFEETRIHNDTKFSYMLGFYAKEIKVDQRAIYCLTERSNSVSKNTSLEAQLTRTRIFAEKNRFLINHKIPLFDEVLTWPFDYYFTIRDSKHFKECIAIASQYEFSQSLIIKKTIVIKLQKTKLYKKIKKIINHLLHT